VKIVDIKTLDQLVRGELDKVEGARNFSVALWPHKAHETGVNWNACVKSIGDNRALDLRLREVLPNLRASFSLDGVGD
jgi:hypothetical protein